MGTTVHLQKYMNKTKNQITLKNGQSSLKVASWYYLLTEGNFENYTQ